MIHLTFDHHFLSLLWIIITNYYWLQNELFVDTKIPRVIKNFNFDHDPVPNKFTRILSLLPLRLDLLLRIQDTVAQTLPWFIPASTRINSICNINMKPEQVKDLSQYNIYQACISGLYQGKESNS